MATDLTIHREGKIVKADNVHTFQCITGSGMMWSRSPFDLDKESDTYNRGNIVPNKDLVLLPGEMSIWFIFDASGSAEITVTSEGADLVVTDVGSTTRRDVLSTSYGDETLPGS